MLVGKDWKIESDSMNVTLFRRWKNKKTGEDMWRAEGYFSSIHNALAALIEQGIRDTGLRDLVTVEQKIEELKAMIRPLLP